MDARIRMMKRKEVCEVLATSSSGLHRGMAEGRFPKPYRTGRNSVRWKSEEISDCLKELTVAIPVEVAPGAHKGRRPKKLEG